MRSRNPHPPGALSPPTPWDPQPVRALVAPGCFWFSVTPMIRITVVGNGMALLEEATHTLGSRGKALVAFNRAINRTGRTVGNEAGRILSKQAGLPMRTGPKAMRREVERSTTQTLTYTIIAQGGDIGLKYFKPRETAMGVSAAPRNSRAVYVGSFMRAGWWPERVSKPSWNGHVFYRKGDGHSYAGLRSKGAKRVGTKFKKAKSGLTIPNEVMQGVVAQAWREGARRLQPRIEHEVRVITKGIVS